MKKWLNPALVLGTTALISACASTNQDTASTQEPAKLTLNQSGENVHVTPEFRTDAPKRYIVQPGDTLWSISERFLKSPWQWKTVWHQNPQIKNPNKIYPGDIISFTMVDGERKLQIAGSTNPNRAKSTGQRTKDGRPVYNLNPSIQYEEMEQTIPTIPREVIAPFMSKNAVLTEQLAQANPYIVGDAGGSFLSLSGRSTVYAKGLGFDLDTYDVYRPGSPIVDPVTEKQLGVEATYVGQVSKKGSANEDGIAPFEITDDAQPLYPNDILLAPATSTNGESLNFLPQIPSTDREFAVIKPVGDFDTATAVQFDTVLINGGSNEGIQEGYVYKIVRGGIKTGVGRNGEKYNLPDYDVGLGVVYKVYSNVSYVVIMNAYDVIYAKDRLIRP